MKSDLLPGVRVTEKGKWYHLRVIKTRRWAGTSAQGEFYWKLFMGGSDQFAGGTKLNRVLASRLDVEAVEAKPERKKKS